MSKINLLLAMGLATLVACAPKPADTAADEAALRADPVAWFDAFNAGDADAIAALYTEDAVFLPPNVPAVAGRAAIRDYVASDIEASKGAGIKNNMGEITGVGVSGDLGWVSGSFSVTDASGATVDTGKFLSVYQRVNGDWQMIRDTWNSNAAPAPAGAPAPESPPSE
jgi:uncharacterized protein (TIGR02246 family)